MFTYEKSESTGKVVQRKKAQEELKRGETVSFRSREAEDAILPGQSYFFLNNLEESQINYFSSFADQTASNVVIQCCDKRAAKRLVLAKNRAKGRAFEQQQFPIFASQVTEAQEQITIRTPSGIKTRVDAIGRDSEGKIQIREFKASARARLTKNQEKAQPEIEESGAVVVGKGKGSFTGGVQIPKGTVTETVRPQGG